jgi:TatD DNase family protein
MLFDTHCHLDFPEFADELPQWLDKMKQLQITQVCLPAIGPSNWERVLVLAKQYPAQICCALGIHPCFPVNDVNAVEDLRRLVRKERQFVSAIGEIGLDGRFNDDESQEILFTEQLAIAREAALPVIVHCVKRHHRVLPLLKDADLTQGGVIHAFNGDYNRARQYVDLGYKLGVGSTFMWPSASTLRETLSKLPIECLLFETDAPDMPLPGAKKGTATPLDVTEVAEKFCLLRRESTEMVIANIYQNSCTLLHR